MRLALAQINSVVRLMTAMLLGSSTDCARRRTRADLVLFPELAITGYPPEDLLFRPGFLREARRAAEQVAAETTDVAALVGVPWLDDLANGCAICAGGEIKAVYPKRFLPNYGVFDEGAVLPTGPGDVPAARGRSARRPDRLRGHLAARPAATPISHSQGPARDREHLRLRHSTSARGSSARRC